MTGQSAAAADDTLAADIGSRQFMHLRHTAATRLANAGASVPLVATRWEGIHN